MHLRNLACAVALLIPAASFAQTDYSYCTLPGELVSDDAQGDLLPVPAPISGTGLDLTTVNVAEPAADDGPAKLYFTLKIDRQAQAATPQTRYYVNFTTPDGVSRFVRYTPYPIAQAAAAFSGADQMFSYGHIDAGSSKTDGPAEAASAATPDGYITVVVKAKSINVKPGDLITDIEGEAALYTVAGRVGVDTSDTLGSYVVKGNDSCKSKKSAEQKDLAVEDKSGTSFGGAFAPGMLLGLIGFIAARRRRR